MQTGGKLTAALAARAAAAPALAASDDEVAAAAARAFAADQRHDRKAAAAAAAGCAARAAGATKKEAEAAVRGVEAGQMSQWLLRGAAAEVQQAFVDSTAKTPYLFATAMEVGNGPERQLLQRLEQREARLAAALQTALGLSKPLAPFFCKRELASGHPHGRLRAWCNSFYRWD